jgi:phospholipase C
MTDRCKWLIGPMLALAAATGLAACSGGTVSSSSIVPGGSRGGDPSQLAMEKKLIKHIVLIVQENRSFDNMFNGYPGADSAQFGTIHTGQSIPLQQVSIAEGYNISHTGKAFFTAWNKGKLDSFDLEAAGNVGNAHGYILVPPNPQYAYVPPEENKPYWLMAASNSLADRMFQSNIDASFVAHQYLIRGWASSTVDNPQGVPWGCDAPAGQDQVATLLANQKYGPLVSACFDATTLGDELNAANKTWHYYAPQVLQANQPGFNYGAVWSAYGAINHIRHDPRQWCYGSPAVCRLNIRWPETDILKDVPRGELADVTWITPKLENSDHPSCFTTNGPSWVAAIVNAIGQSKFWKDTAIIVTWDDNGGWYDHVQPLLLDYDGPGFRVPLIMISPYSKQGYISHVQFETGSELKFIENVFGLRQLAASDARANDLTDMFDFTKPPHPFVKIPAPIPPEKFINQKSSSWDPPDDM